MFLTEIAKFCGGLTAAIAGPVIERSTADLKVSTGKGSNSVIDIFHNWVSGMILEV